jgi:hypothetical protein
MIKFKKKTKTSIKILLWMIKLVKNNKKKKGEKNLSMEQVGLGAQA